MLINVDLNFIKSTAERTSRPCFLQTFFGFKFCRQSRNGYEIKYGKYANTICRNIVFIFHFSKHSFTGCAEVYDVVL